MMNDRNTSEDREVLKNAAGNDDSQPEGKIKSPTEQQPSTDAGSDGSDRTNSDG